MKQKKVYIKPESLTLSLPDNELMQGGGIVATEGENHGRYGVPRQDIVIEDDYEEEEEQTFDLSTFKPWADDEAAEDNSLSW